MSALTEGLRVAMLGTTDGGFIDPNDASIPAGEMFRLAAEFVESLPARVVDAEVLAEVLYLADRPLAFDWAEVVALVDGGTQRHDHVMAVRNARRRARAVLASGALS